MKKNETLTQKIIIVSGNVLEVFGEVFKSIEWAIDNELVSHKAFIIKPGSWLVEHGITFWKFTPVLIKISGISKFFSLGKLTIGLVVHIKKVVDFIANPSNKAKCNVKGLYCVAYDVLRISLIVFGAMMPMPVSVGLMGISAFYSISAESRTRLLTEKRKQEKKISKCTQQIENRKKVIAEVIARERACPIDSDEIKEEVREGFRRIGGLTPTNKDEIEQITKNKEDAERKLKDNGTKIRELNNSWFPGWA